MEEHIERPVTGNNAHPLDVGRLIRPTGIHCCSRAVVCDRRARQRQRRTDRRSAYQTAAAAMLCKGRANRTAEQTAVRSGPRKDKKQTVAHTGDCSSARYIATLSKSTGRDLFPLHRDGKPLVRSKIATCQQGSLAVAAGWGGKFALCEMVEILKNTTV
ncbi:hypothetical protein M513_09106 [Trichuris suis]|uniref:Uncharacterized protein n=1 Tax=Trichuris suis TaxID=68888 RepID=A0A085LYG7_9BILA|nr:hypothetical protein M513_09106 [Trichuris suis]